MNGFLKRVFGFIKQNPSILYSLFLIVFLPLILWWNTSFTVKSFEKDYDYTLQTKAVDLENILVKLFPEKLSEPKVLQKKIENISKENPEIKNLRLIVLKGNKFKILASQNKKEISNKISDPSLAIAWYQNQNIAHLVSEKGERFWEVIKPMINNEGKKIGLISMALSLQKNDILVSKTAEISYLVVILTILVSLFLIFQHTRLFQYLKLYKELEKIDKTKDSFIRMATHELQSPIVNIRAYIEALQEEISPLLNEEQKEYFSRIDLSAKNLSNLINDILEVARIEQGRLDLTPKKISPSLLVEEIVEEFKLKANQKNLKLVFNKMQSPCFIYVNPNRFKEILTNLIGNAIKYTQKGTIELKEKLEEKKKRYFLSVEDTGIGISGEDQKHLFEKFYRVKNKETAGIPGTGLGLWIVKRICHDIKGNISLESIKGVGSKFTISFPLAK